MITWDCQALIPGGGNLVDLSCDFTSGLLAIEVTANNQKNTWFKAGYLNSYVEFSGSTFLGKIFTLKYGNQLIEIPYANYRLNFQPVNYAIDTRIKVKELSDKQAILIMPTYNRSVSSSGGGPPVIADSLPTTASVTTYASWQGASAYQILPANPSRKGFAITNTGTAIIYIDFDAPTALEKRFTEIAPNSTHIGDLNYVGAIFAWSSTTASQSCEIREFV